MKYKNVEKFVISPIIENGSSEVNDVYSNCIGDTAKTNVVAAVIGQTIIVCDSLLICGNKSHSPTAEFWFNVIANVQNKLATWFKWTPRLRYVKEEQIV